jgi:soluble lytic murein transglycosylase
MPGDDKATLGFVLSRLTSYGLVDLANQGITSTTNQLLEQAIVADPFSYEALVARAVLGRPVDWPATAVPAFQPPENWDQTKAVWESLIDFGLARRLAAEVIAFNGPLDPAFVDHAVGRLEANGFYRPALQLLYRLLKDPAQPLTQERAARLFPTPFEEIVSAKAQSEGLEVSLLYGLIRAESSFDTDAKSWVGAQGLTQLMPATAAETAQKLRMKTYDLGLPEDNIAIGARYLSDMIRDQGRIYLALMAYNAGGGRIKPWKTSMGKLPEEIFVEAAPLQETRGYVKKILVSTVMTGMLHYGKTLDSMVRLIYPGFQP